MPQTQKPPGKKARGGKSPAPDSPAQNKAQEEKPSRGKSPTQSEKPSRGKSPSQSEKPSRGKSPSQSEKPSRGKSPSQSEKPSRGQSPSQSEKPSRGQSPTQSEKPSRGQSPTQSEKPSRGQSPSQSEEAPWTESPPQSEKSSRGQSPEWDEGQAPSRRRSRLGWVLATLAALMLIAAGVLVSFHVNASIVHLESVEVVLEDLPDAFDGVRVLYLSDIHLMGVNTPQRAAKLFSTLAELKPDLLLLGGDYTGRSLWEALSQGDSTQAQRERRQAFFQMLADFPAPMGKFAAVGNHDSWVPGLEEDLALGGITLLRNQVARIRTGDQALMLVGLDDHLTGQRNVQGVASQILAEDCAIVLAHNPDSLPGIAAAEAANGGKWADLILAGHTHGGQIRLFGWSPYIPSAYGERYLTGWIRENGHLMLVSNGTGCTGINLRWGAPAQAHLITFRKAE